MKTTLLSSLLLIVGLFLYNYLFWQETLGINTLLFSIFLLGIAYFKEKQIRFRKEIYYATGLSLIAGIAAVWHNSGWSSFMLFLTSFMSIGFIKQKELTTVFESIIGFLVSYISSPLSWLRSLKERKKENRAMAFTHSFLKLCIAPLIIFALFFFIYKNANPKFDTLTASLTDSIALLFKNFSFARFFFLLLGLSFLSVAFVKSYLSIGPIASHEDELKRKTSPKRKKPFDIKESGYLSFINEYKVGLLVFGILNFLLLIVNIIDINWIWFGFEVPQEFNLKSFVHEGTYLLIFSILLSMVIFLYFFRGNLNFFSKNKWLVWLGKVWIVQNLLLTISVFIRNYHYIDYHGLAGKRIGVIAFLLMTSFGLMSLIYKLNKKKTTAFLVRLNGWFIVVTMTLMATIHWDKVIANHNLNHSNTGEIDVDYYLKLDETVSPILLSNLDVIEAQINAHKNRPEKPVYLRYLDIETFKEQLRYQTSIYLAKRRRNSWASWNRADYRLKENTLLQENLRNYSLDGDKSLSDNLSIGE